MRLFSAPHPQLSVITPTVLDLDHCFWQYNLALFAKADPAVQALKIHLRQSVAHFLRFKRTSGGYGLCKGFDIGHGGGGVIIRVIAEFYLISFGELLGI